MAKYTTVGTADSIEEIDEPRPIVARASFSNFVHQRWSTSCLRMKCAKLRHVFLRTCFRLGKLGKASTGPDQFANTRISRKRTSFSDGDRLFGVSQMVERREARVEGQTHRVRAPVALSGMLTSSKRSLAVRPTVGHTICQAQIVTDNSRWRPDLNNQLFKEPAYGYCVMVPYSTYVYICPDIK
jgi:hypothetical protein